MLLNELKAARFAKSLGHRPFFHKSYRGRLKHSGFVVSTMALKAIEQPRRGGLPPTWLRVPRCLDVPGDAPARFVIKSVSSLCRAYLFSRAAPEARFIHVVRHPCAVVASRLRGIANGLMSANTYLESLFRMDEAAHYPFTYERMKASKIEEQMAYQWMIQNDKVFEEMRDGNYRLVKYEELCQEPRRVVKGLFEFAELAWDTQTEQFIKHLEEKASRPLGYHSIMRSPRTSVDLWRRQLDRAQIKGVLDIVCHSSVRECGLGW